MARNGGGGRDPRDGDPRETEYQATDPMTGEPIEAEFIGAGPLAERPRRTALQTKTSYSTAVQVVKPRNLVQVERRIMEEARMMGDAAYYGWGVGKDAIEGPSVDLALAAARVWGNCVVESGTVQDLPDAWIYTAAFIDLETGFTVNRPFRQSKKWQVYGKLDAERKDDVRFQIGASKAQRNVILKGGVPAWLIDKAMDAAKEGVRAKVEKLIEEKGIKFATDILLAALAKAGVYEPAILARFGLAAATAIDVERLVIMRGDLKALQRGEARPEELYPTAVQAPENGGTRADNLAARVKSSLGVQVDAAPPPPAPPETAKTTPEQAKESGPAQAEPGQGGPIPGSEVGTQAAGGESGRKSTPIASADSVPAPAEDPALDPDLGIRIHPGNLPAETPAPATHDENGNPYLTPDQVFKLREKNPGTFAAAVVSLGYTATTIPAAAENLIVQKMQGRKGR